MIPLWLTLGAVLAAPERVPPEASALPIQAPPPVETHTLSGGGRVWLLERHEAPLVRIDITLGWGSALTATEDQLSALHAGMLLGSGTKKRSGPELADDLADLGATWNVGMNTDTLWARLEVPTGSEEEALALVVSALRRARFPTDEGRQAALRWSEWRKTLHLDLDRTHQRALNHAWYPTGHPLRHTATAKELKRLDPGEAEELVGRVLAESNPLVIAVGDTNPETLLPALEAELGDLGGRMDGSRPPPVAPEQQLVLIDLPGAPTARLSLLTPGPAFDDMSLPSTEILSQVLMGGDTSRIQESLNQQQALVYRLETRVQNWSGSGRIEIHTWTDPALVVPAMESMSEALDALVDGDLTQEELVEARNQLAMKTARAMGTNEGTAQTLERIARRRSPPDYLAAQAHVYNMLALPQVIQAAETWLSPRTRIWVITGDRAQLEPALVAAGHMPNRTLTSRMLESER